MSGNLTTHRASGKAPRSLIAMALLLLAGTAVGPPLQAQPSASCQFAVTAYVATQVELESARKAQRRCKAEALSACQVEWARIQDLQHRLKMARDYMDRYCIG